MRREDRWIQADRWLRRDVNVNGGWVGGSGFGGSVHNVERSPFGGGRATFCTGGVHNVERSPFRGGRATFCTDRVARFADPRLRSTFSAPATDPGSPTQPQFPRPIPVR